MLRSRSNKRKSMGDLELRLGLSMDPKDDMMMSRNGGTSFPGLITIEDDDDDDDDDDNIDGSVTGSEAMPLFPISSSWVPVAVITEEDLELRLGFRAYSRATRRNRVGRGESLQKMKFGLDSSKMCYASELEGVKLKCTICMDVMKEETSTMCGHLFCKSCITNAIQVQNRCPTCRKEITTCMIHRIYLPGTNS